MIIFLLLSLPLSLLSSLSFLLSLLSFYHYFLVVDFDKIAITSSLFFFQIFRQMQRIMRVSPYQSRRQQRLEVRHRALWREQLDWGIGCCSDPRCTRRAALTLRPTGSKTACSRRPQVRFFSSYQIFYFCWLRQFLPMSTMENTFTVSWITT